MEALSSLEKNLKILLSRYENLQKECARLKEENDKQRQEIMRTHADYIDLQERYKRLRIAKSLSETPEQKEIAKRHITNMIVQINRVIEILKK